MKRSRDNRVIAGVCAGIADELDVDPIWIRGLWLLLTFGTCGFPGGLIYILAWMLMPEE